MEMVEEVSSKASAQKFLRKLGVYERVKASWIYDAYWRLADSRVLAERNGEVDFYRRLLKQFPKGGLIFDIGANQGYKSDIFLRLGASVVAVDPDPLNQDILIQKFLRRRFSRKSLHIEGKAVSDSQSVATMWLDAPGSAKNTLNRKWVDSLRSDSVRFGHRLHFAGTRDVETTTVEALIERYGVPFFIKIDVEGHELAVLRGMKRPVKYLSFEVNLPEFVSEGRQCIDRLNEIEASGLFNYAVDCQGSLALKEWMPHRDFLAFYGDIQESSVEIFWRT
jgi:FkbM family methyltransferase